MKRLPTFWLFLKPCFILKLHDTRSIWVSSHSGTLPLLPISPAVSWPISVCLTLPQALGSRLFHGEDSRSPGSFHLKSVVLLELQTSHSNPRKHISCFAHVWQAWELSSCLIPLCLVPCIVSLPHFLLYPQHWDPAVYSWSWIFKHDLCSDPSLLYWTWLPGCLSLLAVLLTRSELVYYYCLSKHTSLELSLLPTSVIQH